MFVITKSDELSNQFRAEGNDHFRKKEFYKALKLYNKVKFQTTQELSIEQFFF